MSIKIHDSDCATNNAGTPELLGTCDCSKGDGISPRLLGMVENLEQQIERLSRTPKTHKDRLKVDSQYRAARARLFSAIKVLDRR